MSLTITRPETLELVSKLASQKGIAPEEAVHQALLAQEQNSIKLTTEQQALAKKLKEIASRCAALPVLDDRPADEVLGYDENGLPS